MYLQPHSLPRPLDYMQLYAEHVPSMSSGHQTFLKESQFFPAKPASPILYPSQLMATPFKLLRLTARSHPPHALTTARLTHRQISLPSKQISSVTASHGLHGHPLVKACHPLLSLLQKPPSRPSCFHPCSLYCLTQRNQSDFHKT